MDKNKIIELATGFEDFDSFFAGLSARQEKKAMFYYQRYIISYITRILETL